MRRYLCFAALLILILPARVAAAQAPLAFEVSIGKELSASPVDGRILLLLSKDGKSEPRFGIAEGIESQQAFGVDVDALAPGAAVRIDSTTLGYPLESLRDVPAGDYYVQAVLNIYETFHLGNGKIVKLPPDRGEGQHWQTKPGNFLSNVQKLHLDPRNSGIIHVTFDHKIPALEEELADVETVLDWRPIAQPASAGDSKWEKHVRMHSDLLSKFWGRPTDISAVVLLPTAGTSILTRTTPSSFRKTTTIATSFPTSVPLHLIPGPGRLLGKVMLRLGRQERDGARISKRGSCRSLAGTFFRHGRAGAFPEY